MARENNGLSRGPTTAVDFAPVNVSQISDQQQLNFSIAMSKPQVPSIASQGLLVSHLKIPALSGLAGKVGSHPRWSVAIVALLVALCALGWSTVPRILQSRPGAGLRLTGADSEWRQAQEDLASHDLVQAKSRLLHCLESWPV